MSAWQRSLEDLKREACSEQGQLAARDPTQIPQRLVRGWRVLVSYGEGVFNMSASLFPRGRSSTKDDWEALGKIVHALGAPEDPLGWPKDPNAPVHWMWPATGDEAFRIRPSSPE